MGAFDTPTPTKNLYYPDAYVQPSGILAASGTSSVDTYCGPWMVETQRLDIDYVRVPKYSWYGAGSATLSALQWDIRLSRTSLDCRVTASYTRVQDTGCYQTSDSVIQPQTFQINGVSADANGMIYGTDAEFDASTLGPMGSLNTLTEWSHRRKWVAGDTEVDQSITAYNMGVYTSACIGLDNAPWFGNFLRTPQMCSQGTPLTMIDPYIWESTNYYIYGPYSYNKENMNSIISFLQSIGIKITNTQLYNNPTAMTITGDYCYPNSDQGISEYDRNRHQYTF